MKHLGLKRTPVYVHPAGRVRMRDIITKGHKARERRSVLDVIDGQLDAGDALLEIACDTSELSDDEITRLGDDRRLVRNWARR